MPTAHRDPAPNQINALVKRYEAEVERIVDKLIAITPEITVDNPPGEYIVNDIAHSYLKGHKSTIIKFAATTIAENTLAWEYADRLDTAGLHQSKKKVRLYPCNEARIANWMLSAGGIYNSKLHKNLWEFDTNSTAFILSQHHGLPTRLLDWTSRSHIAAFFAAEKVFAELRADSQPPERKICVWAVNSGEYMNFQVTRRLERSFYRLDRPGLGSNNYIHAQEGMFAYDPMAENLF